MAVRMRKDMPLFIQEGLRAADELMASDQSGNIHRVGWGERTTRGEYVGHGIVITVKQKGDPRALGSPFVPRIFAGFPTDVQEAPEAEIQLLRFDESMPLSLTTNQHQQCHNTPIPGGVEIQPIGKGWVGTLGCKVVYRNEYGELRHGAITNWHVATGKVGQRLTQPGGNSLANRFGQVTQSPGLDFAGTNKIDLSVLGIQRIDGPYAPKTHTVKPEQLTLGRYQQSLSDCGVGCRLARDGRTLGRVDNGRCTQLGATVRVGYGESGTAWFIDQFVATAASPGFSAPGDSGSMVFEYPDMKPFGLLFAGGSGTTIISPAEYAIELGGVHSFQ